MSMMTTDKFCFYLQNRLTQTGQTGGQQYSDTSPFSIPWLNIFGIRTKFCIAILTHFSCQTSLAAFLLIKNVTIWPQPLITLLNQ
jgi:hypothetical protein